MVPLQQWKTLREPALPDSPPINHIHRIVSLQKDGKGAGAVMNPVLLANFVLSFAGIVIVLAALSDAMHYRIPNSASLCLLLAFPFYVYLAPITIAWEKHLLVFAVLLVLGYLVFVKGWAGAGDIKLMASVGLWAGPAQVMTFLFVTAISGGILALGLTVSTLVRRRLGKQVEPVAIGKIPVPYGIAIALGGLCSLALLSHPDLLQAKV
jgi:prepilin peptidase CpaA